MSLFISKQLPGQAHGAAASNGERSGNQSRSDRERRVMFCSASDDAEVDGVDRPTAVTIDARRSTMETEVRKFIRERCE